VGMGRALRKGRPADDGFQGVSPPRTPIWCYPPSSPYKLRFRNRNQTYATHPFATRFARRRYPSSSTKTTTRATGETRGYGAAPATSALQSGISG
jgi:hypothetical protein